MKRVFSLVFCFLLVLGSQQLFSQDQITGKAEAERENQAGRLLIENWTGVYYHGSGTPYTLNKRITISMNDLQVGFNLLRHREKFLGPFFRNRITYEPKKHIPWFNIVENAVGFKFRPGAYQIGVEIASLKYLSSARFKNIGGLGWDLLEKDRSEYTALRIFGSFWDEWRKGRFCGEEWGQVYYHGPGTKDINKDNVIGMTNLEMDFDLIYFKKDQERPVSILQFSSKFNGAIDTKRFPWNNFYEGALVLQFRYSSFRIGVEHVWGNFHKNAQFKNIGGKGWDMDPERPYKTWRLFLNLWLSYRRDR